MRAELKAALDSLSGRVAVRSSGVAEDLAGASFAGQYETILDVDGAEAVEAAIARCIASAHAPRVTAYREQRGIASAAMAVLVQKYIPALAAGVAFTAHPVTGERDVVCVSAIAGVGEALVSGRANAEEWEVRETPVRRRGTADVLTDTDANAVAALARTIAQGRPTDIEWAITKSPTGATSIHLLQARAMTALPDPISWAIPHKQGFIRNFRLGEWIGAPVTPLFESWIVTDLETQLHGHFAELFAMKPTGLLHVVVNGWYFYGGMDFQMGALTQLRMLPRMIAVIFSKRRAELFAAMPPLAHLGFAPEVERWRRKLPPAFRETVARAESDIVGASVDALPAIVQSIIDTTAIQLSSIIGVAGYAAKTEGKLFEFWKKHLSTHDGSVIALVAGADLVHGPHEVEQLDPFFPTLGERGAVPPPPSAETKARVLAQRDEAERRALAALPTKRHQAFLALIAEARRAHAIRREQTGVLTLGWPVLRQALLRIGAHLVAQRVMHAVDDVFFLSRTELTTALAGARLDADIVDRRRLWESRRRLAPPLIVGEMGSFMKQIFGGIEAALHTEEHDAPDALVGMPGSPGRVTGPARVIFSVDELDRLAPGEILVCPLTTPSWTLAFGRALAIVTDTGSIASHASIVAREHGLPAVVGTADGTTRIIDGQTITVDGGRGVVRLGGNATHATASRNATA